MEAMQEDHPLSPEGEKMFGLHRLMPWAVMVMQGVGAPGTWFPEVCGPVMPSSKNRAPRKAVLQSGLMGWRVGFVAQESTSSCRKSPVFAPACRGGVGSTSKAAWEGSPQFLQDKGEPA